MLNTAELRRKVNDLQMEAESIATRIDELQGDRDPSSPDKPYEPPGSDGPPDGSYKPPDPDTLEDTELYFTTSVDIGVAINTAYGNDDVFVYTNGDRCLGTSPDLEQFYQYDFDELFDGAYNDAVAGAHGSTHLSYLIDSRKWAYMRPPYGVDDCGCTNRKFDDRSADDTPREMYPTIGDPETGEVFCPTTYSAWSHDGGQTWEHAGSNTPPVYGIDWKHDVGVGFGPAPDSLEYASGRMWIGIFDVPVDGYNKKLITLFAYGETADATTWEYDGPILGEHYVAIRWSTLYWFNDMYVCPGSDGSQGYVAVSQDGLDWRVLLIGTIEPALSTCSGGMMIVSDYEGKYSITYNGTQWHGPYDIPGKQDVIVAACGQAVACGGNRKTRVLVADRPPVEAMPPTIGINDTYTDPSGATITTVSNTELPEYTYSLSWSGPYGNPGDSNTEYSTVACSDDQTIYVASATLDRTGGTGRWMTSTDGVEWMTYDDLYNYNIDEVYGVIFADGVFVKFGWPVWGSNLYANIRYSYNGKNWNGFGATGTAEASLNVKYLQGKWYVCKRYGLYIQTGNPGDSSVRFIECVPERVSDVAYGGGKYVAVGLSVHVSDDGVNWQKRLATGPNSLAAGVAYGGGKWVIAGGNCVLVSNNLMTWRRYNIKYQLSVNVTFARVIYAADKWFIGTRDGYIVSPDGESWYTRSYKNSGVFSVCGDRLYTSYHGGSVGYATLTDPDESD